MSMLERRVSKDDRNFRSQYYQSVGFRGVDERKTLDVLLTEDPVNIDNCATFALKCTVPSDRRISLWKVILGITAQYPNNRDFVKKWREQQVRFAMTALDVMGKINDAWPKAKNITVTYLLISKQLKNDVEKQLRESVSENCCAVAESLLDICDNDEMDTFWLTKNIFDLLSRQCDLTLTDLVQSYHTLLSKDAANSKLYSHLELIGLNDDIPLETWFRRGFAGVLHSSALERIWDKVIGGSALVLSYVAVALVETSKMSLLGCQSSEEAIRCLVSTTEETDDLIAQMAIELWMKAGSLLMPGDKFSLQHHHHRDHLQKNRSQPPPTSLPHKEANFPMAPQIKIDDEDISESTRGEAN